jgi:hypothetical protein
MSSRGGTKRQLLAVIRQLQERVTRPGRYYWITANAKTSKSGTVWNTIGDAEGFGYKREELILVQEVEEPKLMKVTPEQLEGVLQEQLEMFP